MPIARENFSAHSSGDRRRGTLAPLATNAGATAMGGRDIPPSGDGSHATFVQSTRRPMDDLDSQWQSKGATLSDKTARKEFGLTQDEIVQAIRAGGLHYRRNSIFGNPFLRLLRREVEALVKKKHGHDYLKGRQAKTELARINRELKQLKTQMAALEERKSRLMADFVR
jgi:hypothetical protein